MTRRVSFIQLAFADAGADVRDRWIMPLGIVFRVRQSCLLGHFLATFSVLTGSSELQQVYGLLSQTIENKKEPRLTAT